MCLYEIRYRMLPKQKTAAKRANIPLGLEEVAVRMVFEAEQPKFLMFERE